MASTTASEYGQPLEDTPPLVIVILKGIVIVLYTVTTPDITITKIDTRDLFINTPTQIYDFLLNR